MKKILIPIMVIVFLAVVIPAAHSAGPSPTMYTLDDIYYYIAEGTVASWGGHSMGPAPGVPGMDSQGHTKSLEDIYNKLNELFDQCDLEISDIPAGKTAFITQTANWGPQYMPPPTPTPTPQPWIDIYGPSGTGDVVQIGSMYVASDMNGTGCANNDKKNWSTACSWATGLDWLGKSTGWRMPTNDELSTICSSKESLASYQPEIYWAATEWDGGNAWFVIFSYCGTSGSAMTNLNYVRAVRDSE